MPATTRNLIVAQLQLAFLQLHNSFVRSGKTFHEARRLTRWHFQWLVVNDFLPRLVGADVLRSILEASPYSCGHLLVQAGASTVQGHPLQTVCRTPRTPLPRPPASRMRAACPRSAPVTTG